MDGVDPAEVADHGWKLIDQYPAVGLLLVGIGVAWWLLKGRSKKEGDGDGVSLRDFIGQGFDGLKEDVGELKTEFSKHAEVDRENFVELFREQKKQGEQLARLEGPREPWSDDQRRQARARG